MARCASWNRCGLIHVAIAVVCLVAIQITAWAGVTTRVSVSSTDEQGNGHSSWEALPSISAGGRFVAFSSAASNLVPGDTNASRDAFVRDRLSGTTERVRQTILSWLGLD